MLQTNPVYVNFTLNHLPLKKLFIYFLFCSDTLHYLTFLFISFETSFLYLFIASCHHLFPSSLLSLNHSVYLIVSPHTLWALSNHSHWATHFSCTFRHCPFHLLPYILGIISIFFYSLPLRRPSKAFSIPIFPQFLTSNPPSSSRDLFSLNLFSY